MAKGGTLANIGQALAGYGSALSGNPLYLQNVLIQRQAQQQEQEREQAARQAQVGNAAALNFLRGSQLEGTPETKAFEVNGRIVGQNRAASPMGADPLRALAMMNNPSSPLQAMAAQQAVNQLFPQQLKGKDRYMEAGGQIFDLATQSVVFGTEREAKVFEPVNMQVPGTDRFAMARNQQEFNSLADRGFVRAGTSIPGAQKAEGPKDTFADEAKLRGEFDAKTKEFGIVRDAYGVITEFAQNPSPAGDISLVFQYMKLQDPNSSVREGEYATAQNAAGVPERVRNAYNAAMTGKFLTPAQRADFVSQSGRLYGSRLKSYQQEEARYRGLAQQYGFDPNRVVYDRSGGLSPSTIAPPTQGQIMDGYRFNGGDPANPDSWSKVN